MTTAAGLWHTMEWEREPFLLTAREASELTLSYLVRDLDTAGSQLIQPYNSLGARGVNSLAAKMVLALLPPNTSFFRLMPDFGDFAPQVPTNVRTQIDEALRQAEKGITEEVETSTLRVRVGDALKHAIVSGNAVLFVGSRPRTYGLPAFVARHDANDLLTTLIIKEWITPDEIPPEVPEDIAIQMRTPEQQPGPGQSNSERKIPLYTRIELVREEERQPFYLETQEIGQLELSGSAIRHEVDEMPWIHLRMNQTAGEDYGRGIVEENLGDLRTLDGLTRATIEAAASLSKVLFLVDPRSITHKKQIAEAPNGAMVDGRGEDVTVVQANKGQDLSFTHSIQTEAQDRLAAAFLLRETLQRNAERVTAEEIRLLSQELDNALGGIYSLFTVELQLPMVRALLARLTKENRIFIPVDKVKPAIVTGLDAIGRGHELARLDQFVGGALQTFGPPVMEYLNLGVYLQRRATAVGIDQEGLIRSDQEVAAARQQAQMLQLAQSLGPEAIKQVGGSGLADGLQQALAAAGGGNDGNGTGLSTVAS